MGDVEWWKWVTLWCVAMAGGALGGMVTLFLFTRALNEEELFEAVRRRMKRMKGDAP